MAGTKYPLVFGFIMAFKSLLVQDPCLNYVYFVPGELSHNVHPWPVFDLTSVSPNPESMGSLKSTRLFVLLANVGLNKNNMTRTDTWVILLVSVTKKSVLKLFCP